MRKPLHTSRLFTLVLGCVLAALTSVGSAAVVSALPGGTVYPGNHSNSFTPGPVAVSSNITWSASNPWAVYGFDAGYGFNENGVWAWMNMAGTNNSTGWMEYAFAGPVQGVGGFVNYATQTGTASVSVYDTAHNLLEIADLNFLVGAALNQGKFVGFMSDAAEIAYFRLQGGYVGVTDLTVLQNVSAVPLPAAAWLFGSALLGLFGWGKRRQSQALAG